MVGCLHSAGGARHVHALHDTGGVGGACRVAAVGVISGQKNSTYLEMEMEMALRLCRSSSTFCSVYPDFFLPA